MTHTIADAEAAIARHPDDLATLSMAADLLQELDDPRGEDFAACLDGRMTAEDLMRRHPACRYAMFVAAWAMEQCESCHRKRFVSYRELVYGGTITHTCSCCASDPEARAEALRLLAECGKVGTQRPPTNNWYFYWSLPDASPKERVCDRWWHAAHDRHPAGNKHPLARDVISARLALLDAYAAADPDTRRQWAEETRALTPTVEVAR